MEAGKSPISKKLERSSLDSSASTAQAAGSTGANTETQGVALFVCCSLHNSAIDCQLFIRRERRRRVTPCAST